MRGLPWAVAGLLAVGGLIAAPGAPRAEGSSDVVVLPPLEIVGTARGPAVYVIDRATVRLERAEARDSFVDEVAESVEGAPF